MSCLMQILRADEPFLVCGFNANTSCANQQTRSFLSESLRWLFALNMTFFWCADCLTRVDVIRSKVYTHILYCYRGARIHPRYFARHAHTMLTAIIRQTIRRLWVVVQRSHRLASHRVAALKKQTMPHHSVSCQNNSRHNRPYLKPHHAQHHHTPHKKRLCGAHTLLTQIREPASIEWDTLRLYPRNTLRLRRLSTSPSCAEAIYYTSEMRVQVVCA